MRAETLFNSSFYPTYRIYFGSSLAQMLFNEQELLFKILLKIILATTHEVFLFANNYHKTPENHLQ